MKKKTNNILAVILIILGIVMLFPIYILFMVSFRNEKTVFVGSLITASPSFESIKSAITPDFLVAIGNFIPYCSSRYDYCFNSSFNVWIRICKNEFSGEKANVYSDHQYFDDSGIVYSCTFVYDM